MCLLGIPQPTTDPCLPSPCGPHSSCQSEAGRALCACDPGTLGAPPSCRPQCLINQDCPLALACLSGTCVNPCIGSCGFNARCVVQNHQPICSCDDGYSGDPFSGCSRVERKFFNYLLKCNSYIISMHGSYFFSCMKL